MVEEVNTKYKASLRHNYLLVSGLAKGIEIIQDRQEKERNETCKRKLAAMTRDMHLRTKVSTLQNPLSETLQVLKSHNKNSQYSSVTNTFNFLLSTSTYFTTSD